MDESRISAYIEELTRIVTIINRSLQLPELTSDYIQGCSVEEFGAIHERTRYIGGTLNEINDFIVNSDPKETLPLRKKVVELIPLLLMNYQLLRVLSSGASKESLSKWPEIVEITGLKIPVSTCLRLIAVCLLDSEVKQCLVDVPLGVKAIVSHMADDPLNPFQREGAIFAIKVLTTDFSPGQDALSSFTIKMDYIEFALADECMPILASIDDPIDLDESVLDDRCKSSVFDISLIDEIPDTEPLLSDLSFIHSLAHPLVLSLSGGVDSMSLLVCLVRLRVPFIAVHIRHSSREEDTEKELNWVRWMCRQVNVPLYYHHVLVARPHGGSESCISRSDFEEYTRQIRMAMYFKAAKLHFCPQPSHVMVLVGHHLDDVDENRISELGKGNLLGLDGMGVVAKESTFLSQVRPWCVTIRKMEIFDFAKNLKIPHMRNSTPEWSKRGWIRKILDMEDIGFVAELASKSRAVEEDLKKQKLKFEFQEFEIGTKHFGSHFFLGLQSLLTQLTPLVTLMEELKGLATKFGSEWNTHIVPNCPIQRIRSEWDSSLSLLVYEVFKLEFSKLSLCFPGKFVPRTAVSQLVEFELDDSRNVFTWKVNRVDYFLVKLGEGIVIVSKPTRELKQKIQSLMQTL